MIGVYYMEDTDDEETVKKWRSEMAVISATIKQKLGITGKMLRVRHFGDRPADSPIHDDDIHWAFLVQLSDNDIDRMSQVLSILPYIVRCEGISGETEYMMEWNKREQE